MTHPKQTRQKHRAATMNPRKRLTLEQRGRFWQSVGEALRAQARARAQGNQ